MSDNTKLTQGLIVGFIAGGVAGAVLGLLYAPKSGKELRGEIRQKSGELATDVEEYLKDAQAKAKQLINDGKEKSTSMIQEAKRKAEELMHDAETILDGARSRVTDEGGKLKDAVRAGIDAYRAEPGTPGNTPQQS